MIDIFELRKAKYLWFYVENGYIYCENLETDEKVIVGEINDSRGKMDIRSTNKIRKNEN